ACHRPRVSRRPLIPLREEARVGAHASRIQIACCGSQLQSGNPERVPTPSTLTRSVRGRFLAMRKNISTENAPKAIGPYAQAVVASAGTLVFCSGQIPLDPKTGEMVGAGDVRQQTEQVLENLGAVLAAAGASFASVVKTTIFLADLQDFGNVNEVY